MSIAPLSLAGPFAIALLAIGFRALGGILPPKEGQGALLLIELALAGVGALVSGHAAWTGKFGGKARTARGTTAYETRRIRLGPGWRVLHAAIALTFLAFAGLVAVDLSG